MADHRVIEKPPLGGRALFGGAPAEQNRRAWNEIHRRRSAAIPLELGLRPELRERMPPLHGLRILQPQCATGETLRDLHGLGALVTGVDISEEALALARELVPEARLVRADVQALPPDLRQGEFDLVLADEGCIPWLHDLAGWARGIAEALRPGGVLVQLEAHPIAACLGEEGRWEESYFDEGVQRSVGWSHFDLPGEAAREEKHQRHWRLGEVVTALAGAGLVVRALEEFPQVGSWRPDDARLPGRFFLRGEKP